VAEFPFPLRDLEFVLRTIAHGTSATRLVVRSILPMKQVKALFVICVLSEVGFDICAQDIEPRAHSNDPVSVNVLIAGYAYTRWGSGL
jgi:hypothetical protein